jgi:hypothetical protein
LEGDRYPGIKGLALDFVPDHSHLQQVDLAPGIRLAVHASVNRVSKCLPVLPKAVTHSGSPTRIPAINVDHARRNDHSLTRVYLTFHSIQTIPRSA